MNNTAKERVEKERARIFKQRLYRLNKLVDMNIPPTLLFDDAVLLAKSCVDTDNVYSISNAQLIEQLDKQQEVADSTGKKLTTNW